MTNLGVKGLGHGLTGPSGSTFSLRKPSMLTCHVFTSLKTWWTLTSRITARLSSSTQQEEYRHHLPMMHGFFVVTGCLLNITLLQDTHTKVFKEFQTAHHVWDGWAITFAITKRDVPVTMVMRLEPGSHVIDWRRWVPPPRKVSTLQYNPKDSLPMLRRRTCCRQSPMKVFKTRAPPPPPPCPLSRRHISRCEATSKYQPSHA